MSKNTEENIFLPECHHGLNKVTPLLMALSPRKALSFTISFRIEERLQKGSNYILYKFGPSSINHVDATGVKERAT